MGKKDRGKRNDKNRFEGLGLLRPKGLGRVDSWESKKKNCKGYIGKPEQEPLKIKDEKVQEKGDKSDVGAKRGPKKPGGGRPL